MTDKYKAETSRKRQELPTELMIGAEGQKTLRAVTSLSLIELSRELENRNDQLNDLVIIETEAKALRKELHKRTGR